MSALARGARVSGLRGVGTVVDMAHESCPPAQRVALVQWDGGASEWWGVQSLEVLA